MAARARCPAYDAAGWLVEEWGQLAARGMIRGVAGLDAVTAVGGAMSRTGAWLLGLSLLLTPPSVVISVLEWWQRHRSSRSPGRMDRIGCRPAAAATLRGCSSRRSSASWCTASAALSLSCLLLAATLLWPLGPFVLLQLVGVAAWRASRPHAPDAFFLRAGGWSPDGKTA